MNADTLDVRPLEDGDELSDDEFEVQVPVGQMKAFESAVRRATERLEQYRPLVQRRLAVRPVAYRRRTP